MAHVFGAYDHYGVLGAVVRMHQGAERYLSQVNAELLGSDHPCRHDKTSRDCDDRECWNAARLVADVAERAVALDYGHDIGGDDAQGLADSLAALDRRYQRLQHAVENHRAYLTTAAKQARKALDTSQRKDSTP